MMSSNQLTIVVSFLVMEFPGLMESIKDLVSFLMVDYFLPSCDILEIRNGSSSKFFSGDLTPSTLQRRPTITTQLSR